MSKRQRETMTAAPEVPYSPGAYTDPFDEAMDREEPSTPDPGNGHAEPPPSPYPRSVQASLDVIEARIKANEAKVKALVKPFKDEHRKLITLRNNLIELHGQQLLPSIDPAESMDRD